MANINEKVMNTFEGADFVASNTVELTLVEELVMDVMEANNIAYDDPVVDELFEAFDKLDEDALGMVQKHVNQLIEMSKNDAVAEGENLQELDLKTLHSYNGEANKEIPELQKSRKQIDKYKDNAKKVDNRLKGSQKAFDKALEKTKAKNAVVKEDVNEKLINEAIVANPAFKIVKTQLDKDYDSLRDAIKVWKISKYKSMIASLKKGESCYLTTPFRQVYESLDSKAITKETLMEALDDIYNAVLVDQLNEHFEVA